MNAANENPATSGLNYAVLRKKGRLLVLVNPSDKELRRRSKRRWQLVAGAEFQSEVLHTIEKTLDQVVADVTQPRAKGKKDKKRQTDHVLAAV